MIGAIEYVESQVATAQLEYEAANTKLTALKAALELLRKSPPPVSPGFSKAVHGKPDHAPTAAKPTRSPRRSGVASLVKNALSETYGRTAGQILDVTNLDMPYIRSKLCMLKKNGLARNDHGLWFRVEKHDTESHDEPAMDAYEPTMDVAE